MHVDHQAVVGGDSCKGGDGVGAILHGAFEMRDATDHVHAFFQGAEKVFLGFGVAEEAVLREGDELDVEIGFEVLAEGEEGVHRQEAVVADVDMAADGEGAAGDGPEAEFFGAVVDGVWG